jgi:hypothetical protein
MATFDPVRITREDGAFVLTITFAASTGNLQSIDVVNTLTDAAAVQVTHPGTGQVISRTFAAGETRSVSVPHGWARVRVGTNADGDPVLQTQRGTNVWELFDARVIVPAPEAA